jgi:signal transduction histidine kinase
VKPRLQKSRGAPPVRESYGARTADPAIFGELKTYVGFDDEDARLLAAVKPFVAPRFGAIVDAFYQAAFANPHTSAILDTEDQIARLKASLHDWLAGILSGVYDGAYFEQRARIGRTHVRVGLEQRFMLASMNVVRTGLHRAVDDSVSAALDIARVHAALDRICDIELAIMLETYREDYILRRAAENETLSAMGRLTAGLAHEVRNPLNAAKLQLEVLKRAAKSLADAEAGERIASRADIVLGELSRLGGLLDDFLALARPRGIEPEPVALGPLIDGVVDLEAPAIREAGIAFEVSGAPFDLTVRADAPRIKQVLVNLIKNAVEALDATPAPAIAIEVVRSSAGWAEVRVIDNGPGVDPSLGGKIFEAFTTSKEAGTGLGLTIVKAIVEQHGGEISIDRADDRYTVARFTLPIH